MDEITRPLDYSRLPVPTPPSELYPSWVLGMLWVGLAIGTLFLAGLVWWSRVFGW